MIPVGARVRMSSLGKASYKHSNANPHYLTGIVIENRRKEKFCYSLDCRVEWENKRINSYDYNQLEVLTDLSTKSLEDYL